MKKIGVLAFAFLIFFLTFSISFAKSNLAAAQEISPTPVPQADYELPYPGLLPDSPLYFLRMIRDRAISFLISDPLKKSEFDLLQADKRLNAGIYLFNKGKISLALSTISKAENYFEQALVKMGEAKIQGKSINEIEKKLRNALKKHRQELEYMTQKVSKNIKGNFEREQERLASFEERLNR